MKLGMGWKLFTLALDRHPGYLIIKNNRILLLNPARIIHPRDFFHGKYLVENLTSWLEKQEEKFVNLKIQIEKFTEFTVN